MPDIRSMGGSSGGVAQGNLSLFLEAYGNTDLSGQNELALQNAFSNAGQAVLSLNVGDNTINVPAGTTIVVFAPFPATNPNAWTYRKSNADSAWSMNPAGVGVLTLPSGSGATSFIINVSTAITLFRFWFY